jgi:superfamily II DNA or RNA helicase
MMDVLLRVEDAYTYVVTGANPVVKGIIRGATKARPEGYQFMPRFRAKRWDGFISLYEAKEKRFPSGLFIRVLRALEEKGITVDADYEGSHWLCGHPPLWDTLRPYQKHAAQAAMTHEHCVLHMATNAGKTYIIAYILQATGHNAVVVVPTRALLTQTADKLEQLLGMDVGRYGAGQENLLDMTVTTIASLGKLTGDVKLDNRTLIVDECHHTSAETLYENLMQVPGMYRIGVSGTPLTYDDLRDLKLMAATGPVVHTLSNAELIEDGWSVKPEIKFVIIDTPKIGEDVEYDEAYRAGIVNNDMRNQMIGRICAAEKERGPVLVLANWVEHVNEIMHHMPGSLSSASVTGQSSNTALQRGLDWLRDSEIDVLVATDVYGEGIDVPAVATLVLAGGGRAHIKLLQKIGRGLRTAEDKNVVHVWDFLDDTSPYLLEHSEARHRLYKREGFEVELDDAVTV